LTICKIFNIFEMRYKLNSRYQSQIIYLFNLIKEMDNETYKDCYIVYIDFTVL